MNFKSFTCLVILLAAASSKVAGQESFIEFSISDTVHITSGSTVYAVTIGARDYVVLDSKEDYKESIDRLYKICNRQNLSIKEPNTELFKTFDSNMGMPENFLIEFTTLKELSRFYEEIKGIPNLSGYVSENKVSLEQRKHGEQRLLEKIKSEANSKANLLAKLYNKKVGEIESMTIESDLGNWSIYPPIGGTYYSLGLDGRDYFQSHKPFLNIYQSSIKFRFKLNSN
jgi:hypothetical protein